MKRLNPLEHLEKQRSRYQQLAETAIDHEWQLLFEDYVRFYTEILIRVSEQYEPTPMRHRFNRRSSQVAARQNVTLGDAAHH